MRKLDNHFERIDTKCKTAGNQEAFGLLKNALFSSSEILAQRSILHAN